MIGWEEYKLGNLVEIGRGASPRPIKNYVTDKPGIPWVKIADATKSINKYIEKTNEYIVEEGRRKTVYPGELIVSNSATPGIPKLMKIEACVHDGWLVFDEYKNIKILYLYYFFLDYRRILVHSASGTVFKNLTTEIVKNVKINLPPLKEQKAIAKVLTVFDDKIELLQEQNKTLETMAQTIIKEWFGKYQIGDELPKGWRVGKLGDVIDIFDSKRVPLSKGQREAMSGDYRYYGATKVMDYVNDYLFDGIYLLFAEDGSVMDEDGYPFLQYVWGKFWVNNHTHILKGKNSFSTELIYVLCKKMKVTAIVTGAVQLKINQGNLLSKEIVIPNNFILEKADKIIQPLFSKLRINSSQIQSLKKTRDTLLPKLMSGQVRVNNIKQTANA